MELPYRETLMPITDLESGPERELALAAIKHYLGQVLTESKFEEVYRTHTEGQLMALFLWRRYREMRCWLEKDVVLACALQPRQVFPPWWAKTRKNS